MLNSYLFLCSHVNIFGNPHLRCKKSAAVFLDVWKSTGFNSNSPTLIKHTWTGWSSFYRITSTRKNKEVGLELNSMLGSPWPGLPKPCDDQILMVKIMLLKYNRSLSNTIHPLSTLNIEELSDHLLWSESAVTYLDTFGRRSLFRNCPATQIKERNVCYA